jgi:hypothetical protein
VKPRDREHPTDERLLGLYFDHGAEPVEEDKALRQHLHGCEACTWRYTALTAPLQQLRQDASSEADEVFTPGRLAAQRAAIRHRLDEGSGSPRVVAFPGAAQPARPRLARRPAARWMAGAAAAGLLLGVTAGRLMDLRDTPPTAPEPRVARSVEPPPVAERPIVTAVTAEFGATELNVLYGYDTAIRRPHVEELNALDEMTPHPEEMRLALR